MIIELYVLASKSQVLKLEIFSRMNETCNLSGIAFLTDTNS